MLRWMGFLGYAVMLAIVPVSGCKEKTHIMVIQQAPPPPPPLVVEAQAPEPVPAPAPVVVEPAPAPVVVAPAPVVVEPVATPAVSVGFFVEKLGHHGHWVIVGTYGRVWVPAGVAPGWEPYTLGHWVYTDYGWTWVSE